MLSKLIIVLLLFSSIKSSSSHQHYTSDAIKLTERSLVNSTLGYGYCPWSIKGAKNCSVALQTNIFDPSTFHICQILVDPEFEFNEFAHVVRAIPSGKNSAVFTWIESFNGTSNYYLRLKNVQFPSCKYKDAKLRLGDIEKHLHLMNVLPSTDGYDVVYASGSSRAGIEFSKVTLNAEGKVSMGPIDWFVASNHVAKIDVLPISEDGSGDKGYLVLEIMGYPYYSSYEVAEDARVSIVGANGKTKLLRNYKAVAKSGSYYMAHSLTNGRVGACFQTNFTVICSQFDVKGNLKLEKMLPFDYELLEPALHNLPGGGFLLMTTAEEEDTLKRMPKEEHTVKLPVEGHVRRRQVTKVKENGQVYQKYEIEKYGCELVRYDVEPRIFEAEMGKYCLVMLCYGPDTFERGVLDAVKTCFEDKDFLVSPEDWTD